MIKVAAGTINRALFLPRIPVRQGLQDAAVGNGSADRAAALHCTQLSGKFLQIRDFCLHLLKVTGRQRIYAFAGRVCFFRQTDQLPDLIQREAERPATADKAQTVPGGRIIFAIVAAGARWLWQQADFLVITYGDYAGVGAAGKFANLHLILRLDPIVTIDLMLRRLKPEEVRVPCNCGCSCSSETPVSGAYRRILWAVFAINAGMFVIEAVGGGLSGSAALQADALDFFSDAGNYAISLAVLGAALSWRARAAFFKGACMGLGGLWVAGMVIWHLVHGTVPHWQAMGLIGLLALLANASSAFMLYRWRHGDANMHSVWICSRNDMLSNIAVMLAGLGVFGTGAGWPDIAVAAIMAALGLQGAFVIMRGALREMRTVAA